MTELSREESCPAGAVQDTHCSGLPAAAAVELMAFWKWNAEQFTILSLTAHRILCISAS